MAEEQIAEQLTTAPVVEETAPIVAETSEVLSAPVVETVPEQLENTQPQPVEQLEVTEEVPVESKPEALVEAKVETVPETKEALAQEIVKTKEELAVIKEVRDELVALYAQHNDLKRERETLSKQVSEITGENTTLKEQLQRYVEAENSVKAKLKADRIESLSAKFKKIGQEKSVEQLSAKDEATLEEFEKIVDAALSMSAEKEMPNVTMPSQAVEAVSVPVEALSEAKPEVTKTPEKLAEKSFFANICGELSKEQTTSGSRRALRL